MKPPIPLSLLLPLLFVLLLPPAALPVDEAGRIYTTPDTSAPGGITGRVPQPLTFAIAIDHELKNVYRGLLAPDGKSFQLTGMPVGKYDLVLVTKDGRLYEGLALGDTPGTGGAAPLPADSRKNLEKRIALADSFFNRHIVHRFGFDGEKVLAFVERLRDKLTLRQSGEKLDSNVRRLEVVELDQAADDWQMVTNRHLYREAEPIRDNPPFFKTTFVSGLGNLRVIDTVRDLGVIPLPSN